MAKAMLINPVQVVGGKAYEVDTCPFDARPFTAAAGRRWAAFKALRSGEATYQWQTGADRVREVARQLMAGQLLLDTALADPFITEWLDRRREAFIESIAQAEPAAREMHPERLALRMLLERGARLTDAPGPFAYYDEKNPEPYLRDAADALDLPPWARVRLADDGGPGTGFTAVSVWLSDGHSLRDLAEWLSGSVMARRARR